MSGYGAGVRDRLSCQTAAGAQRKKRVNKFPYLFIAPFFLSFLCFGLLPMIFTFVISFHEWGGYNEMKFIGLQNYATLFQNKLLYQSIGNTLLIICITIPCTIFLALVLSYVINNILKRGRTFYSSLFFLPYLITPVAIGIIFRLLFDRQNGFFNMLLTSLGVIDESIFWFGTPDTSRFVVITMIIWKNMGYFIVLICAGLQTISPEYYESAKIDGANAATVFFKITLPLLKPTMTFCIITSIISGFQLFAEPLYLFSVSDMARGLGGPGKCVYTIVTYMYESAFINGKWGTGSSIAYVLFLMIVVFSLLFMKIINRKGGVLSEDS